MSPSSALATKCQLTQTHQHPKFIFRVSHSVSLDKYILTHTHFHSVIWNITNDPQSGALFTLNSTGPGNLVLLFSPPFSFPEWQRMDKVQHAVFSCYLLSLSDKPADFFHNLSGHGMLSVSHSLEYISSHLFCVYGGSLECVFMCINMCVGGQRLTSGVFLNHSPAYLLTYSFVF